MNGIGTNKTEQQVEACITQKNLSNICEDVYGDHHYAEELTVDQEATCSEEGSKSYHCIRCDAKGKSFVIPKINLTHVDAKAATAESTGNIEYWHCEKCGKYFSDAKAAHEITLEQTVTEKLPGKEAINNLPKTGDDSRVALWLLLLAVSGGVLLKNFADRRKNTD